MLLFNYDNNYVVNSTRSYLQVEMHSYRRKINTSSCLNCQTTLIIYSFSIYRERLATIIFQMLEK